MGGSLYVLSASDDTTGDALSNARTAQPVTSIPSASWRRCSTPSRTTSESCEGLVFCSLPGAIGEAFGSAPGGSTDPAAQGPAMTASRSEM